MCCGSNKIKNLESCSRLVNTAAGNYYISIKHIKIFDPAQFLYFRKLTDNGAKLVCLPECCLYISGGLYTDDSPKGKLEILESLDGNSMRVYKELAANRKVSKHFLFNFIYYTFSI